MTKPNSKRDSDAMAPSTSSSSDKKPPRKSPQGRRKRLKQDPEDEPNDDNDHDPKGVARSSSSTDETTTQEWDEETHRFFAEAIYELGLRNSSPAVILENMVQQPQMISSERVKSKLQKYRNQREKSKQEFMEDYNSFIRKAKAIETAGGGGSQAPGALLEMMGSSKLYGGDVAAFLSYAVMKEREIKQGGESLLSTAILKKGALEYVENFSGTGIAFPKLSEEEKKSSLGVSMTFIMGLFLSMTQHIMKERARTEGQGGAFLPDGSSPLPQFAGAPQILPNGLLYDTTGHHQIMGGSQQPARTIPFSLDQAAQQYVRPAGQQQHLMPIVQSGHDTVGEKQVNDAGNPNQTEMV
jgi:SHAQKYF class myb-like DNA-binding protein